MADDKMFTNLEPEKPTNMSYPAPDSPSTEVGSVSQGPKGPILTRFVDSFRQQKGVTVTPGGVVGADGKVFEQEVALPELSHSLKPRHLQMIAIGGSIGTGLFVGSGSALEAGGPASLVIAYGLIGAMLFCTVHALGEMAVTFPVAGSFAAYSTRFLDPAWGFAMGWNYALQWLITLPLEIIAASITLGFWEGSKDVNPAAWVTIFLLLIIAINFFGVKGYGEAEFVFSIIKVAAVIGFIILGIVLNVGGGPNHEYIGARYWYNPGAFHNGFKGLCSVFVTAAFSFAGTELVGLAAAETENPRKALPTAIKQVFWRILLFYMVSLTIVGVLVPYNDPALLNGGGSSDANASPFVIAIRNAGVGGIPSVMNVVIMIAVLSVGNSAVYGSSRTLAALADQGQAPKILGYIDRKGRPLISICVASGFGFLCYLVAAGADKRTEAFNWMLAISGLASIFTWGSICLCHIRFRAAWKKQGRSLDELAFRSQAGVIGSWCGFVFNILVLMAQFWTGFAPVGYGSMTVGERIQNFFEGYLAAPIVVVAYVFYKVIYKTKIVRSADVDLHSGMRELNVAELIAEERAEMMTWPRYKKIWRTVC
ncbi:General amino-acid permease GAP1 [Phlyctema vagabunda]|uniref:General amino-acid permease GAP1 n=1 Tax=Phlyctema vagabunda TaxID=108571 RepID=A0ABR4PY44_9HELO